MINRNVVGWDAVTNPLYNDDTSFSEWFHSLDRYNSLTQQRFRRKENGFFSL
jgi:hypothetical protein